ncbi:DUF1801 domain-containing protein [soil metagenome]
MKDKQKPTKSATAGAARSKGFTAEERAAMQERAKELKSEERSNRSRAAGEADLLAKIAEMSESDRAMAERIHAVVQTVAPGLSPKTWYGMPAWATENGKVMCFFTPADKFKERYATFGFNAEADLDDGNMWPTSWALTRLTAADEKRIGALVKKAVS